MSKARLKTEPPPALSDTEAAQKLTEIQGMDELAYQRHRLVLAKQLGVSATGLDKARATKPNDQEHTDDVTNEIADGIKPWPEKVCGEDLAKSISESLKKYCVLPDGAEIVITLWIIAHYCIDHCRIFPKLLVNSPQMRCGKTTLLEVIQSFSNRGFVASNVSAAVIFRIIEAYKCTLLLDEADTWIHSNEELRGIINSGNTKSTAVVWRIEGDDRIPTPFCTFAPMVLAMIGTPPATINDRSVTAQLRRKMPHETVERLPIDLQSNHKNIRQQLKRWSDDNGPKLRDADPKLPKLKSDRMADNFGPLAAVAEIIGGGWPGKLRETLVDLNTEPEEDSEDDAVQLLRDLNDLFTRRDVDAIHSAEIVIALNEMEDRPWIDLRFGNGMSQHKLAALLKPFNIRPKQKKINSKGAKAYTHEAIIDAYTRYASTQNETSDTSETNPENTGTAVEADRNQNRNANRNETALSKSTTETETKGETQHPHKAPLVSVVSDVSVSGGAI